VVGQRREIGVTPPVPSRHGVAQPIHEHAPQIWLVGSAFEIAIFGGVPLLWLLAGERTQLHRFRHRDGARAADGHVLFCLSGSFLEICVYHRRHRGHRAISRVLLLLIWPVLQINRGVGVWALLEILGIYLLVRKIGVSRLLRAVAVLILAVLILARSATLAWASKAEKASMRS
jgi:hypothetical protein